VSSSIAQKVDTQARVIRSLNLIHCSDTQHMVGAVELERLLNLEADNVELKRRIQRLEEAGDAMVTEEDVFTRLKNWRKAKEANP